jgi:iron complex transport system substrate-binding protein
MKQTPAVVHHRYLKLKYQALTPGPVNIEAIHKLAQALYPAAVS